MSTTDILETAEVTKPYQSPSRSAKLLRRIGRLLLTVILVLLSLLTAIPVILLFVVTSVPLYVALILALLDVGIVVALFRFDRTPPTVLGALAGFIVVSGLAVYVSQMFASTPAPSTPGGFASMEQVELNGSQQWITIRGNDVDNPVLLFLAGGPGGSELVMTRRYLGELENHFTVVNWDQPGTGKSYHAVDISSLTPEAYVADAYELTLYLRERFHQQKIYVLGESWGSILGIWLVQQHPELYHAVISTGQMVDAVGTDRLGYEFAIELRTEQGRLDDVEALRRNGPPPYASDELIGKFSAINNTLNGYMNAHAHGEGVNHNLLLDSLAAPEYGLLDKVNWLLGLMDTFTTVYPQIYDLDFRTQATQLDVPVYFVQGRWDVNAMSSLVEEYFDLLDAPHKELIWFEDSAHTPLWDEPKHFVDVMVNTVLAQTSGAS